MNGNISASGTTFFSGISVYKSGIPNLKNNISNIINNFTTYLSSNVNKVVIDSKNVNSAISTIVDGITNNISLTLNYVNPTPNSGNI